MKEKIYSEAQKSFLNKRNFIETAIEQLKNTVIYSTQGIDQQIIS